MKTDHKRLKNLTIILIFVVIIFCLLPIIKVSKHRGYVDIHSGKTYSTITYFGIMTTSTKIHENKFSQAVDRYKLTKTPEKWLATGGIDYYGLGKGYNCSPNGQFLKIYDTLYDSFIFFNTEETKREKIIREIFNSLQQGVKGRELSKIVTNHLNKLLDNDKSQ